MSYDRAYLSSPGGSPAGSTHWSDNIYSPTFETANKFASSYYEPPYGPKTIPTVRNYNTSQNFPMRSLGVESPIKQSTYRDVQSSAYNIPKERWNDNFNGVLREYSWVIILLILYLCHVLWYDKLKGLTETQIYMALAFLVMVWLLFT
jgi:hypothetical protein